MMACAACVFGLILGELQEIYATANTKARELDDHMESVVSFLQQNKVPKEVELRIKNWIRFQYPQQRIDLQARMTRISDRFGKRYQRPVPTSLDAAETVSQRTEKTVARQR